MSGMVSAVMRGKTQEQMLRRRDASGEEMTILAKVMNDPKPNAEQVTSYIRGLMERQHIAPEDARRLLATVPHDPDALRTWAQKVFAVVMHHGIHAHAAFPRQLFPSAPAQAPVASASPAPTPASPADAPTNQ